ncbi:MAG: DUF1015 domain-containing protein [Rhodothermaceae bacterium]
MAIIRPFKAVRPDAKVCHLVASVPYDVVNRAESSDLVKDNPINFLRVTRSEVELPDETNAYDKSVYEKARANYVRLKEEAPMVQDETPRFYVYKLVMGDTEQVGIAATFAADDYDNDIIMKHEKTRKVKEDDRTNHIVTTEAQTGAVFLTYRGVDAINEVVNKTMAESKPEYDFTTPDNVTHTLWVMPEEYNQIIIDGVAKTEKLYIADGHHRAASASRSRAAKKETNSNHNGSEEYNFFMAVLFPGEQLKILPYNRIVYTMNGLSNEEFLTKIQENFSVEESGIKDPAGRKEFQMYLDKKWYTLNPTENVKPGETIGENLDVSILQDFLLSPVLGIGDPRTDENINFVGGIRGTGELEKLVDSGKAKVAFSMYAVDVDDLMNISDAGEIMPPKSTWFEPKLRDGLAVHEI